MGFLCLLFRTPPSIFLTTYLKTGWNAFRSGYTIKSFRAPTRIMQVAAMKDASKTLKAEVKKIDINKVEDLTDDMADMMEDMNEINDIMGRSYK